MKKNADKRRSPASLTKILTAVVALEHCELDDVFEAGEELSLVADDASRAGIRQGQRMTLRTLLSALLLPSGNDAAYVIAAGVARRESGEWLSPAAAADYFCGLMNQKAASIGAGDSHFSSPDGYAGDGCYSTAQDLLLITQCAMGYPEICKIAGKWSDREVFETGEDVTLQNTNELLDEESPYYLSCATGFKTGYTKQAGYCLIFTAEQDERELICVVLGSTETGRWTDSIGLLRYGFEQGK